MKTCTGCNKTKALTEFHKHCRRPDGLSSRCKVCRKAANKKYYYQNTEKDRARYNKYIQRPGVKKKRRAYDRKRSKHPEVKKRKNARARERRKTDPQFKLRCNLRARLRMALKGKLKSASTMSLLGCSQKHVMEHLEKQFLPGMTWGNQGKWHIDHMMPCASFDLSDPEQQRRCFHYTNLQPLWGTENCSKGDNILYSRVWNGFRWIHNE